MHCMEGSEYNFCLCGMEPAAGFDTKLKFIIFYTTKYGRYRCSK
jgi:hypothetical protein